MRFSEYVSQRESLQATPDIAYNGQPKPFMSRPMPIPAGAGRPAPVRQQAPQAPGTTQQVAVSPGVQGVLANIPYLYQQRTTGQWDGTRPLSPQQKKLALQDVQSYMARTTDPAHRQNLQQAAQYLSQP